MERIEVEHPLKNAPKSIFKIAAEAEGDFRNGVVVRTRVTTPEARTYRVEVKLEAGYTATKPHFDTHDFMLTGVEMVKSHIESHRHEDFRIELVENSGLPRSQAVKDLTW